MGLIEKPLDRISGQILGIGAVEFVIIKKGFVFKKPKHMRPPEAVARAVGIFIRIREGVVDPVPGHPVDRPSFRSEHAEKGQEVLQGLWDFKRTVGQEAVITERYADPSCQPAEEDEEEKCGPREGKGGGQGSHVHRRDPDNDPKIVLLLLSQGFRLLKKNPKPLFDLGKYLQPLLSRTKRTTSC